MTIVNHVVEVGSMPPAVESGRICAVAGKCARENQEWTARFGHLFTSGPFDSTLFHTVSLCIAFSAPHLASRELRMANRAALWGFGVDWLIDYVATSQAEVADLVDNCLTVAGGGTPPEDPLMLSLADLRDELSSCVGFPVLRSSWLDQLRLFLRAMEREWVWNAARANGEANLPTLQEYLDNADNSGFSFAFTSHWIYIVRTSSPPEPDRVLAASAAAQRVGRLINDAGTYERDLRWGDLNALMLGLSREDVGRHISRLTQEFRSAAAPLRSGQPDLARYLDRQLAFCAGFYEITDYWGELG